MAVFKKPDQNLSFNIPDIGEVYKLQGNDAQVFKRTPEGIFVIKANQVPNINFGSLSTYNPGDVRYALNEMGLFKDSNNPQATWTTDASLFQTSQKLGGGFTVPVDPNLQNLIQSGGAGIGGFQAGGQVGLSAGLALQTTPEAVANRLKAIQEPITGDLLKPIAGQNFQAPRTSPVFDVSGLEPGKSSTSSASDIAGTLTGPEQQESEINKRLRELNESILGRSAFTTQQETLAGIPESEQALDDLNSRLRDIQRQATAIPIQLRAGAEGRGITTQILGRQQEKLLQDNAIEALTVSSLIDATQNRLTSAQRKVDRAVAEKYNPILEEIAVKTANAKLIKDSPESSAADRKRAAQVIEAQTAEKARVEAIKAEQKEVWNIATDVAKNMAKQGKADNVLLDKIQKAQSKEAALALAIPFMETQSTTKVAGQIGGTNITNPTLNAFSGFTPQTPTERSQLQTDIRNLGLDSETPPNWFRQQAEEQLQQSLLPGRLKQLWDEERLPILEMTKGGETTSSGREP